MKKIEMKSLLIGFAWIAILFFAPAPTRAQDAQKHALQVTTTYAAKFICGVQPDVAIATVPDAQAGRYSSKINIHNNTGIVIRFRKKIISLRGGQKATKPHPVKMLEALEPDEAMEVVCADIYKHLGNAPPAFIEGFVIFEVYFGKQPAPFKPPLDPLDVEGIYTYKGDLPNQPGSGASIDVEVFPAKNNLHTMLP